MNIKYNNSLYCTEPPTTFIPEEYDDGIDESIDISEFERQEIVSYDAIEQAEIKELIKHEPNQYV